MLTRHQVANYPIKSNSTAAIVTALLETVWLPMVFGLFILPVISFVQLYHRRFRMKSISFFSLIIGVGIVVVIVSR
jgi:hypothetical protein